MFYAGWDGQKNRIGAAESMDLINWRKKGLVLGVGDEGDWDFGSVSGPFIFPDKGHYLMFYAGFPIPGYEAGLYSIGVAESTDLVRWRKWPEPCIYSPGRRLVGKRWNL